MGRWGIAVNLFALTYIGYIVIWTPWPPFHPVTASTFNYSGPILIAVVFFALLDWSISGRKRFTVPDIPARRTSRFRGE
jgi:choline transport protein